MSFQKYNPMINAWSQQSPEHMQDLVMMVVLSIQQPWHSVGEQMRDYRELGRDSRFVWGNKRKTFDWLTENREQLYREVMDAITSKDDVSMMDAFLKVDGLGLAKAGFCCQLVAGRVGCIDVHNLRRLNIAPSVLNMSKSVQASTRQKKIVAYIEACKKRRTKWLWDSWCDLIAKKQPNRWRDGDHVSMVHFEYLAGR